MTLKPRATISFDLSSSGVTGGGFLRFNTLGSELLCSLQSIVAGVKPLWDSWPDFGCSQENCCYLYHRAFSLTTGRVCHVTGHSSCLYWQYMHMNILFFFILQCFSFLLYFTALALSSSLQRTDLNENNYVNCLKINWKRIIDIMEISFKVKVETKFSLCLTKHHAMKTYWGWKYSATHSWPRH
jgi:hypothetical protein